jgi:hypothetical protein
LYSKVAISRSTVSDRMSNVRQRVRRRCGEGLVIGPLKSRYSKRDVPIPGALADRLRVLDTATGDLVFRTAGGTVLDPDNLAMRVLAPACKAAASSGPAFTRFVIPSRRGCSRRVAT